VQLADDDFLLPVYHTQIVSAIEPWARKVEALKFGWLIPVGLLFIGERMRAIKVFHVMLSTWNLVSVNSFLATFIRSRINHAHCRSCLGPLEGIWHCSVGYLFGRSR
jgi:hypothetical protein